MSEETVNEVVEQESTGPSEAEVKASRLGWVPKDEFKGNPDTWRDAEEFLQRGEEIHGYLKKDLEKLQTTLTQKDREIDEIRRTMAEFQKFHNETEARAYTRAIEQLKQAKVTAIEQGDGAKVVELDDQISQLKEAQKKPAIEVKQEVDKVNQEYLDWLPNNRWYLEDRELQELAEGFGEAIKKRNPDLVGKAFLDEVTKKVKSVAPEKFENPNRSQTTVGTSSDNRVASSKKKKGYDDLPPDAKAACDRFVKTMVTNKQTGKVEPLMTREQYVKEFFSDSE